jgi:RNA recognition motif-containing protein
LEIKKKSMMQKDKEIERPIKKEAGNKNQILYPNNILFVENLTSDITESIMTAVFSKYNGFKEVRLSQGKGIAFIEYDNEINAGGALLGLNNLHLTSECLLQISFAKK